MDKNLQRLAQALRVEKCPRHVLERVQGRLDRQGHAPSSFGFQAVALVAGLLVLIPLVALMHYADRSLPSSPPPPIHSQADRVQAAQQARIALAYIGTKLLEAGGRAEDVILEKAVPPMRNGLGTVGTKLNMENKL